MNEPKLIYCLIGVAGTWVLGVTSWLTAHLPEVKTGASLAISTAVAFFAIRASLWTARAAKATLKNVQDKRKDSSNG